MIDKALENPSFLLVLIVFLLTLLIIQFFRNQCDKKKLRKDAVKRSKAVINGQVDVKVIRMFKDSTGFLNILFLNGAVLE